MVRVRAGALRCPTTHSGADLSAVSPCAGHLWPRLPPSTVRGTLMAATSLRSANHHRPLTPCSGFPKHSIACYMAEDQRPLTGRSYTPWGGAACVIRLRGIPPPMDHGIASRPSTSRSFISRRHPTQRRSATQACTAHSPTTRQRSRRASRMFPRHHSHRRGAGVASPGGQFSSARGPARSASARSALDSASR